MGFGREIKQISLFMELFDGKSLNDVIFYDDLKASYQLDHKKKKSICRQICEGFSYLHMQNNPILHRDIKPENILISETAMVKICDLGLSTFSIMITALSTVTARVIATVMYMAPEVLIKKEPATVFSDVWSVACTLLELYCEELVWDVSDQK